MDFAYKIKEIMVAYHYDKKNKLIQQNLIQFILKTRVEKDDQVLDYISFILS